MRQTFRKLAAAVVGTGSPTLETEIDRAQSIWNLHFDPATHGLTKAMSFNRTATSIPLFHVTDLHGNVVNPQYEPTDLTKEKGRRMLSAMVSQNAIDKILLDAQRQGRISFYMTGFGEEAAVVGTIAAVDDSDYVFMQYREAAALNYRGYTISEMISQCMGNVEDAAKGRQMPMHFGSVRCHVQTVSSPLATQIPQAAGAGYAFKLEKSGRVCLCYFGDGSASEGDFHAGVNFASTTGAQTLFICRNNGFAISTPTKDQYHGDGITPRGIAYGIPSIRVDGTDLLAVYAATKEARRIIVEEKTPVLLETMAYRVGHHSTSDDSSRYRDKSEIEHFDKEMSPIPRFEAYATAKGWWGGRDETDALAKATRAFVLDELKRQEKLPIYGPEFLFKDTFKEPTPSLVTQREETLAHYQRHKAFYDQASHH